MPISKEIKEMKMPSIVSEQEWEAARQQLLVKEKALTRARDAMAAERRRMPWMAVEKKYQFEGPKGKASLVDLFEGRPQLILYRAFFEPGVFGWPDHACGGCSLGAGSSFCHAIAVRYARTASSLRFSPSYASPRLSSLFTLRGFSASVF